MAKNTQIAPGISLINSWPAVYFKELDAIAISDLHLGYEVAMAESHGIFLPKVQGKKSVEMMEAILKDQAASTLIMNGDIKHEFSETSYHEYKEVRDFFEFASKKFKRIIVLKGNHDTFIIRMTKRFENFELHNTYHEKEIFFAHGHQELEPRKIDAKVIVIGNEHPSIALYDELKIKEKVKVVLFGEVAKKLLIVLPAFSMFALGTDVNVTPADELLSPILQKNIDRMEAIGIVEGEATLRFPAIAKIRPSR